MDKVYFLVDENNNIKIGYTKGNIDKRIQQLQTGNSKKIMQLGWIEGNKTKEKELHSIFGNFRINSNNEWFYPNDEIIKFINENNCRKNTFIDYVDGKLMPLLKISI